MRVVNRASITPGEPLHVVGSDTSGSDVLVGKSDPAAVRMSLANVEVVQADRDMVLRVQGKPLRAAERVSVLVNLAQAVRDRSTSIAVVASVSRMVVSHRVDEVLGV